MIIRTKILNVLFFPVIIYVYCFQLLEDIVWFVFPLTKQEIKSNPIAFESCCWLGIKKLIDMVITINTDRKFL